MKFNETKAILKLAQETKDETLKDFLTQHYLNDEEEKKEEEESKQEEKQEQKTEETKEEKKEEVKYVTEDGLKEILGELLKNVATKEEVNKTKTFGAKGKQGEGKETKTFDDIFSNLTKSQF